MSSKNIHPEFARMQGRDAKERQLGQRAHLFWFYGLSGAGKSTLANAIERAMTAEGRIVKLLDGDNLRSGLNADLGFSDADRMENIRRVAEVSRLFLDAGVVVLASFITPQQILRDRVLAVNGAEATSLIFVDCSFEACAQRDVKGLYAKAAAGKVAQFTGKDSSFEKPSPNSLDWLVQTENATVDETVDDLLERMRPLIQL